ncbi:HMG box-containing protein 1 [Liparis tanakae]|uniref:HMG box-containing protein 1 n=1 Tax=Liparis tanakae TaxID=230148 RepID=A0A4Z2IVT9_9TELE|nr:HMG box-containing protein 1 [Liparis tanakae]
MDIIIDASPDDMPELQEVEEDQRSPGLFQVGAGVSHQELRSSPSTNWLAELANIATSPQSSLLKSAPHKSSAPTPSRGHLRERRRVRELACASIEALMWSGRTLMNLEILTMSQKMKP